jgi:hypothetical protein
MRAFLLPVAALVLMGGAAGLSTVQAASQDPAGTTVTRNSGNMNTTSDRLALTDRADAAAAMSARRNNLVGGSVRNPDGSMSLLSQNGSRRIDSGYTQVPAGAYEGN